MEILAFIIGAGAGLVAGSPMNPSLRKVAKAVVAGALVVGDTARTAAATASEQWQDLVAEAKADRDAGAGIDGDAEVIETITIEKPAD